MNFEVATGISGFIMMITALFAQSVPMAVVGAALYLGAALQPPRPKP